MASSTIITTLAIVQQQLIRYGCSAWIIFGVPGCLLNVILLSRRQFRVTSCCNYFLGASTILIITIALSCGTYLYSLNHPDPITTIRAFCKARLYILQSTMMMGRWMITMACLDRYALSSRNVRVRRFAQVHVARRVILIVIGVWLVLPIHTLIFYEIREAAGICAIVYNRAAALYHSIYLLTTGGIFPATIMIVSALLIRRNLATKRDIHEQQIHASILSTQQSTNTHLQRTRDQNALAMLFIQVIVYCIVQSPQFIYTLYAAITSNVPNKSPDRLAIEKFAFFSAELCVFLFPVSAFYLYILASGTFRIELFNLVHSLFIICFGRWNIRVVPIRNMANAVTEQNEIHTASQILSYKLKRANHQLMELPNIMSGVQIK
ncbi:unnamed protein product [Rotaria sp. Silwood1]|nr:unnamed protein product [Rotaria sp. Silwood1]CAF1313196.1 unnamed protein product [Rotaria sp. Silwood1]CAF3378770.1 unnamed protein product [Rotaria sp. Silwood1]CAF3544340.1 unnamed protein product [Rotaria sp. Silwood1]CAF4750317.1 unnamed protein product [Rotaria sp. Silwood1]